MINCILFHYVHNIAFLDSVGIIVNLIFEQIALYIISTTREALEDEFDSKHSVNTMTQRLLNDSREYENRQNSHSHKSNLDNHEDSFRLPPQQHSQSSRSLSHSRQLSISDPRARMDSCELGAVVAVFANANDPRALLKAYVLEGAIAVHSIIMGISLGSMQNDELSNIKILMIAYAVHQFLEGISLG